jgi:hypothetical protein
MDRLEAGAALQGHALVVGEVAEAALVFELSAWSLAVIRSNPAAATACHSSIIAPTVKPPAAIVNGWRNRRAESGCEEINKL